MKNWLITFILRLVPFLKRYCLSKIILFMYFVYVESINYYKSPHKISLWRVKDSKTYGSNHINKRSRIWKIIKFKIPWLRVCWRCWLKCCPDISYYKVSWLANIGGCTLKMAIVITKVKAINFNFFLYCHVEHATIKHCANFYKSWVLMIKKLSVPVIFSHISTACCQIFVIITFAEVKMLTFIISIIGISRKYLPLEKISEYLFAPLAYWLEFVSFFIFLLSFLVNDTTLSFLSKNKVWIHIGRALLIWLLCWVLIFFLKRFVSVWQILIREWPWKGITHLVRTQNFLKS